MSRFVIAPLQGFNISLPRFQGLRPWLTYLAPLGLTDLGPPFRYAADRLG